MKICIFEAAFLEWLKLYKSPPTRKPSTYASYIATYNTHFAEFFGEMPLYLITQDVGAIRELPKAPLAVRTSLSHGKPPIFQNVSCY